MSLECGSSVLEQSVPGLIAAELSENCRGSPKAARGQLTLLGLEMSHKSVDSACMPP